MVENSKIEWTTHTFNPWIGCTKVSPACDHCYAEAQDNHRKWTAEGWGPHAPRKRTSDANWRKPCSWNRQAEGAAERPRVFCASLSDVFDNHRSIDPTWRLDLFRMIEETRHLDWLLLTKRPQNVARFIPPRWREECWPRNVWLGTSVENQDEAERRIPILVATGARIKFLSCEPLLGALDLSEWLKIERARLSTGPHWTEQTGRCPDIHWVIAGGESGSKARPMHPEWTRSLRDQCRAASVPFHFKQWGEWLPCAPTTRGDVTIWPDGKCGTGNANANGGPGWPVSRVGKKAAGRLLDGREWNEVPQ